MHKMKYGASKMASRMGGKPFFCFRKSQNTKIRLQRVSAGDVCYVVSKRKDDWRFAFCRL